MSERLSKSEKINIIFTILYGTLYITPFLFNNYSKYMVFPLALGWIISASSIAIKNGGQYLRFPIVFYLIFLWLFYITFLRIVGFSTTPWGNIYIQFFIFLPIVMSYFYIDNMKKKAAKIVVVVITIVGMINVFDNIRLLILYPTASVDLNFSWGAEYYKLNIGGTTFSLTAILLCSIFLIAISEKYLPRIISFLFISVCIFYIVLAGRAISFMLCFAMIFLFCIAGSLLRIKDKNLRSAVVVFILLILVLLSTSISSILLFISENISNNRLSERFTQLALMLNGSIISSSESSGVSRIQLYQMSIITFFSSFKNFFIGVGEHPFTSLEQLSRYGVGKHSQIFDLAAQYGLIGFSIMFSIIRNTYRKLYSKNDTSEKLKVEFKIVFIVFLTYAFFNNVMYVEISFLIFFIIPMLTRFRM
jgi:hypothetical protein